MAIGKIKLIVCIGLLGTWMCFSQEQMSTTIFLIGDSTMADYSDSYDPGKSYMQTRYPLTGWGQVFQEFFAKDSLVLVKNIVFNDSVVVDDRARGGRSTRTFFQEGRWAAVYKDLRPNDIVLIQFGHNDAAINKPERYVDVQGYKEFLRLFVNQCREKNAMPIILTPVPRNYPWENGVLQDVHGDYDIAPKEVAQQMGVPLIDLNALGRSFFTHKGKEFVSKNYFMNLPAGVYTAFPEGENDNTHFQTQGAVAVAQIVFNALKEVSQNTIAPRPYTISTTFEKLKEYYPEIKPIAPNKNPGCIQVKNSVYKQTEEQTLLADVYIPNKGKKQYAAVLLVHGGGWISGSKENMEPMAQQFAEQGFVAVSVNYRLSTVAPFPAAVNDLKSALKWMRLHAVDLKIDPDRIAILGASAGAQLASLVGVSSGDSLHSDHPQHLSDKVQAVLNIDGIVSFVHPESEESEIAGKWLGGLKNENFKNWKLASPLEYTDQNSPPILFINSSQKRFHAGRDDMISKLDTYGIYSEQHTLEGSPHSFWLVHPWFEPTVEYCIGFLKRIL